MSEPAQQFSPAFRGYNRDEVDERVGALTGHIATLQSHLESLQQAHRQASHAGDEQRQLIADLQEQVAELGASGYSGLGLRVEKSLQVAEDHAQRLMAQADLDAEKLRRSSEE